MHIGDTKKQGQEFFAKKPDGVDWRKSISDFRLEVNPYIKLSDMYASGLLWIRPNFEDSKRTHNKNFFNDFAGRQKREDWNDFEEELNNYIPDWKNKCCTPNTREKADWKVKFENTQRAGLLLSVGTFLTVYMPYKECQELDEIEFNSQLADKIRAVINEIKQTIDGS